MGVTQHVVNRGLGLGGGYTRVSTLYTKPSCTANPKMYNSRLILRDPLGKRAFQGPFIV